MCPTPSISIVVTRGKVFVSRRATPLDEAGESDPVMRRTGTSSAAKADRGRGLPERGVPFGLHGSHGGRERLTPRLGHGRPRAGPHPVVGEPSTGHVRVPTLERGHRVVTHGDDLPGRGLGRILGDQHREQHGLEQDEGINAAGRDERRLERHRAP